MIETTAKNANGNGSPAELPFSAGSVISSASTAIVITALRGVAGSCSPSTAGSRPGGRGRGENAKHIREALVRQARPQNSWPIVEIITTALNADVRAARG